MNTKLSLNRIVSFEKTYSFSRAIEGEGKYRHIHYGDIHTKLPSVIEDSKILPKITEENEFQTIEKGDILVADASEDYKDLGKAVCYMGDDNKVIAGLHTHLLRCDKTFVNPEYLTNLFQTSRYKKFVWRMGTGVSVLGLSKNNLGKYEIYLPTLEEQNQKSSFFNLLNKKIQLQQQKIDLLQEQKKGYMQKIFNRELRFKDEKGNIYPEWKEGILEDVLFLKLREVPKPKTSYIRLGLRSHAKGTFHQLVTNPEEVSMDKLYVVKKGDLVINITFAWEQALAIAESNDEDKLVSHRFPTYSFKENQYNQFYKYYLTTKYFKYALGNASPGGAGRNRVLNKKDFLKIKLSYPCFKEQSIIADFLDKLDCKVFTELKKLELLQKQKQGFMQQMFI